MFAIIILMTRTSRLIAIDFPHHVVQRGNNREKIFFDKEDKERYLFLLRRYADKWESLILAYCLMDNHVHLLAKPKKSESLFKMMQAVSLSYTKYINKKYRRTGRLWESRYFSCIIDRESYLWTVIRYIEQNPKRASIISREQDYLYSSARAHIQGLDDPVLGEALFDQQQREAYVHFLKGSSEGDEMDKIKYFTKTGMPLGCKEFTEKMERNFARRFIRRPLGRPSNK